MKLNERFSRQNMKGSVERLLNLCLLTGLVLSATSGIVNAVDLETVACDPIPTDPALTHTECIISYTGPEVCVTCHEDEARDMHGSLHYQQGGQFPNLTNVPATFAAAGERPAKAAGELVATGINTYCGTHENSPRFTCAGCHVGNGRFPMAQSEFEQLDPFSVEAHEQLANIDCLTCHQDLYKRFPDPSDGFEVLILENVLQLPDGTLIESPGSLFESGGLAGIPLVDPVTLDFQFVPADPTNPELASVPDALMAISALTAAQTVHPTTNRSCLNCHAGAGGADGAKRGDLSSLLIDPPVTLDIHMSADGANLTCADCHSAVGPNGEGHRFRGRGVDLRPDEVAELFTCNTGGCHSDRPHDRLMLDIHALKVACQTCHIPTYAKGMPVEVSRDWQDSHLSVKACGGRGGWQPREDKGINLIPSYTWFDGTSQVYYLGEPLAGVPTTPLVADVASLFGQGFDTGDPAFVLGMPNGDVASPTAKLYPMKEHWGKLARHLYTDQLIGHSTFEYFRTGDFDAAVRYGMEQTENMAAGDPYDVVAVHTYQSINHGVEDDENALSCGACHAALGNEPVRMDLQGKLGYGMRTGNSAVIDSLVTGSLDGDLDRICSQCHENQTEDRDFSTVHGLHVREKRKDCAACHDFTRPERELSLTRDD